ncbi:LysR substrate-binding domain-containing protein [Pseudomonas sp. FP2300]|uniref:LysR substrate-binding domain-containing protein n=1 Tax=Pseudomonas sp. FP2300 TaxID=2954090 RepID=UPI002734256E|nr:LysR substrate-binding domain-containing protein [Pseudomonas sp. FP2300]WLH65215.1 LysR substrate-binding domain-containing protein [Pseudomonas sp. FP2300]
MTSLIEALMELRHLRYFSALADTLNFTRAADRCHVTQSTLSHQIKQLEEELGVQLFDRIGKRVVITEAGDNLLAQIAPALRQIDVAVNSLSTPAGSMEGNIRIGATYSFNTRLVPQCIASFIAPNPGIRVIAEELSQAKIVERLESGDLDLGIAYRPQGTHDLWFEPLYNEEMVLVVRSDHPLAKRKRVRMVELQNVRMALLPKTFSTRQQLDECFRACGAQPLVVAEMNTIMPMIELIRQTELAGIVGETAVEVVEGLSIVALENPTPIRTPGLLWKRGGTEDFAIKQFAAVVRRATEARADG